MKLYSVSCLALALVSLALLSIADHHVLRYLLQYASFVLLPQPSVAFSSRWRSPTCVCVRASWILLASCRLSPSTSCTISHVIHRTPPVVCVASVVRPVCVIPPLTSVPVSRTFQESSFSSATVRLFTVIYCSRKWANSL